MFQFETEQKVCEVGGVKFGGQPGDYPTVTCSSIFQKGDKVFDGKRKEGFDEKKATELLQTQDRLWKETGVPGMADIVANTGEEFKTYIDFVTSVSDMPFCVDAWVMKPKLEGAAYCAEKGLLVGSVGVFGNVIRVAPPLVITTEIADESLGILEDVLTGLEL